MTKAIVLAHAIHDNRLQEARALADCYLFHAKAMDDNVEEAGYEVTG